MKLYPYDELRKVNQALNSFKRGIVLKEGEKPVEIPILDVKIIVVEGKVQYFVVADPPYVPRPKEKKERKEVKKEEKKEEK